MAGDQDQRPENTREFIVKWNDAVEEHLVHELAQSLPDLVGVGRVMDSNRAAALARHLVHVLRLTAATGDATGAVRYLAEAAQSAREGSVDEAHG